MEKKMLTLPQNLIKQQSVRKALIYHVVSESWAFLYGKGKPKNAHTNQILLDLLLANFSIKNHTDRQHNKTLKRHKLHVGYQELACQAVFCVFYEL
jgi:hypothetical protein